MQEIIVYTDGSSEGRKDCDGGIGAVLFYGKQRRVVQKAYSNTTVNRMELRAVIEALKVIKLKAVPVKIHSDSQYVVHAFTKGWLADWRLRKFVNVKNADLWRELTILLKEFKNVTFIWVKGHAGNEHNNFCDGIAKQARKCFPNKIFDYDNT